MRCVYARSDRISGHRYPTVGGPRVSKKQLSVNILVGSGNKVAVTAATAGVCVLVVVAVIEGCVPVGEGQGVEVGRTVAGTDVLAGL